MDGHDRCANANANANAGGTNHVNEERRRLKEKCEKQGGKRCWLRLIVQNKFDVLKWRSGTQTWIARNSGCSMHRP